MKYANGRFYCFGCNQRGVWDSSLVGGNVAEREVEDVDASISEIRKLPLCNVRGFDFHTDNNGYYILWPGSDYYKKRLFDTEVTKGRYVSPKGNKKPLFTVRVDRPHLLIVEGEINALSIAAAIEELPFSIVSPGSAGELASQKYIQEYIVYGIITIIADSDAPGAKGAIELKAELIKHGKTNVSIQLWDTDANDLFISGKHEEIRRKVMGGGP